MTFDLAGLDQPPADRPTPDQQRDALRKGLGRAVGWAKVGRIDPGILLEACLDDLRYDRQVDHPRADWLWEVVRQSANTDRCRGPILEALGHLENSDAAGQLCGLARHYAEAGDLAFRDRLRAIVEARPLPDDPGLGEEELIHVEGEAGFLLVARMRGRELVGRGWDWDDEFLARDGAEILGEARVDALLLDPPDADVARFASARSAALAAGFGQPSARPPRPPRSLAEVFDAASLAEPCFWIRHWGEDAGEDDLRAVFDRAIAVADAKPAEAANLLHAFGLRPLDDFDPRLLPLCRHPDERLRRRAFATLGRIKHPVIRAFALEAIADRRDVPPAITLFVPNHEREDEQVILDAIDTLADVGDLHWALMGVLDILEANEAISAPAFALAVYTLTPCEVCRNRAARVLLDRDLAPDWLREECRSDSSEGTRELADPGGPAGPSP